MSSINISLPASQVSFIDSLVTQYGFANRSELVRSILRLVGRKPRLLEDAGVFPFASTPLNQSVFEMMADFRATKKYSKAFLKDLEAGLRRSKYFRP